MIIDPERMPISRDALIASLFRELERARSRKPFPYLKYQDELSFSETLFVQSILPSDLDTTTDELESLEHTGAKIATREALQTALNGDLILENIPGLVIYARHAMARYKLTHDQFGTNRMALLERTDEYWKTNGMYYVEQLRKTRGVRGSIELRLLYLHQIRAAMKHGIFTKEDLQFDEQSHRLCARHIFHELSTQYIKIQTLCSDHADLVVLTQRYNYLLLLSDQELREYPR